MKNYIFALFLLSISYVKSQNNNFYALRLYTENDVFDPTKHNKDDNYTGGVMVELYTNLKVKKGVLNLLNGEKNSQSIAFGFTNYTPRNLADSNMIFNDRPYACYRYLDLGVRSVLTKKRVILKYNIYLGSFGNDIGKKFQTKLHEIDLTNSGRAVPLGWHHQIKNGGRFVPNLRVNYEKGCLKKKEKTQPFNIDLSWISEVNLGEYLSDLKTGFKLSWGLHSGFNSFYEPSIPVSYLKENKLGKTPKKVQFEIYAKPSIRYVVWNGTLNGVWFNDNTLNKVNYSEMNNFIFEYEYGLWFQTSCHQIGIKFQGRSKEFSYQNKKNHNWGGIFLGSIFSI